MATAHGPQAYGLLVGLKEVDPRAYGGWNGKSGCWGCEIDVANFESIIKSKGFQSANIKKLLTKAATAESVLASLKELAGKAKAGDIVVFYYSGHGGQVLDEDGDELPALDEEGKPILDADGRPIKLDSTLCCYERQLIDDELGATWKLFKEGVRIVMMSDSCHSGTNARELGLLAVGIRSGLKTPLDALIGLADKIGEKSADVMKAMFSLPFSVLPSSPLPAEQKAMMIHIGACRDNQTSDGFKDGGVFTKALKKLMDHGFSGSYLALHDEILEETRGSIQRATYNEYGPVTPDFKTGPVFTIVSPHRDATTVTMPAVSAAGSGATRDATVIAPGTGLSAPAPADSGPTS